MSVSCKDAHVVPARLYRNQTPLTAICCIIKLTTSICSAVQNVLFPLTMRDPPPSPLHPSPPTGSRQLICTYSYAKVWSLGQSTPGAMAAMTPLWAASTALYTIFCCSVNLPLTGQLQVMSVAQDIAMTPATCSRTIGFRSDRCDRCDDVITGMVYKLLK